MHMRSFIFFSLILAFTSLSAQNYHFKIGKLKYEGGGDWYSNPTALPNLIRFVNQSTNTIIASQEDVVDASGTQIFQYP